MLVECEALVALRQMMDLAAQGFVLCGWVSSGEEAVQLAREKQPDVALMDVRLTGQMDGIEALRQIRAFSNMPVMIVASCDDDELRQRVLALRPSAYLVKPVEGYALAAAIRALLNGQITHDPPAP